MNKLDKSYLLGYLGCLLTIVATFLPFATIKANVLGVRVDESVSLLKGGDGWFFIIIAIVLAIFLTIKLKWPFVIVYIIYVLLFLFEYFDARDILSQARSYITLVGGVARFGVGLYVLFFGLILLGYITYKIIKDPDFKKEKIINEDVKEHQLKNDVKDNVSNNKAEIELNNIRQDELLTEDMRNDVIDARDDFEAFVDNKKEKINLVFGDNKQDMND